MTKLYRKISEPVRAWKIPECPREQLSMFVDQIPDWVLSHESFEGISMFSDYGIDVIIDDYKYGVDTVIVDGGEALFVYELNDFESEFTEIPND